MSKNILSLILRKEKKNCLKLQNEKEFSIILLASTASNQNLKDEQTKLGLSNST